ncbi:urease accessory protein UreH domain-containing protein [Methylomagnum sp.]
MRTRKLSIGDMHCEGCETVIEQAVGRLPGVRKAKANYQAGTLQVNFDLSRTDLAQIAATVKNEGYTCGAQRPRRSWLPTLSRLLGLLAALAAIGWLLVEGETLANRIDVPQFERGMSYGLLFLVGLLTGFHCVGMCGGFVVGYTAREAALGRGRRRLVLPHALYGFAKVLSYTLIGGAFGLLGSVIAFTPEIRGYAAAGAGAFLVLFGINMLDWFPALHRIGLHMPRWLSRFLGRESRKHRGPFAIGLLNGLMIACGPLQAMYVMAAGTGSLTEGAVLLLVFGLGTLPLMLGFGLLAGAISGRITHGLLKVSALLVVALGLIMLNRGLLLSGSGYDFRSLGALAAMRWEQARENITLPAWGDRQTIRMAVTGQGYAPNRFVLKQGVPVEWLIEVKELTYCNRRLVVPALSLELDLKLGENRVEFTPDKPGVISFSCWMGMLRGAFVVEPAAGQ